MWCPDAFSSFGSCWRGFARGTALADRTGGNAVSTGTAPTGVVGLMVVGLMKEAR